MSTLDSDIFNNPVPIIVVLVLCLNVGMFTRLSNIKESNIVQALGSVLCSLQFLISIH